MSFFDKMNNNVTVYIFKQFFKRGHLKEFIANVLQVRAFYRYVLQYSKTNQSISLCS